MYDKRASITFEKMAHNDYSLNFRSNYFGDSEAKMIHNFIFISVIIPLLLTLTAINAYVNIQLTQMFF